MEIIDRFYYDGTEKSQVQSRQWTQSKYYPEGDKTAPRLMPEKLEIRPGDTIVEIDMGDHRILSIERNGKVIQWF